MPSLTANDGHEQGKTYPINVQEFILGRHPDCGVIVDLSAASRYHCKITAVGESCYIEDLNSRNGTLVNEQLIESRHLLHHGDQIRVCDQTFTFHETDQPAPIPLPTTSAAAEASNGSTCVESNSPDSVVIEETSRDPVPEFFDAVRRRLEQNHLQCPRLDSNRILQVLTEPDSAGQKIFGQAFRHVVLIDLREALVDERFDHDAMMNHIWTQFAAEFELEVGVGSADKLFELLKAPPQSLFCFLFCEHLPADSLQFLRGLLQIHHRVLLCGTIPWDAATWLTGSNTRISQLEVVFPCSMKVATQVPKSNAEARLAALVELMNNLSGAVSVDEVMRQILDSLFHIFKQAEHSFIALLEGEALVPKWSRVTHLDQDAPLRISRAIAQRALDGQEGVLSADAINDERFEGSESVAKFHIRSMICAPLVTSEGDSIGILQVDTMEQRRGFDEADLELLISVATQAAIAIDNARMRETMMEQRKLKKELQLASQVQQAFLPREHPQVPGYEFFALYLPAHSVGGDFFSFTEVQDGKLAIVIADVVGHGVTAALFMAKFAAEARSCLARESDPGLALTELNNRLCQLQVERFVTAMIAVLDPASHRVNVANAGHVPAIRCRPGKRSKEVGIEQVGTPLGVIEGQQYWKFSFRLRPGDSAVVYTDGVTESRDSDGNKFSIGRLKKVADANTDSARGIGQATLEAIRAHTGGRSFEDDVCLIVFQRTAGG